MVIGEASVSNHQQQQQQNYLVESGIQAPKMPISG
jgi:hypothetical protein